MRISKSHTSSADALSVISAVLLTSFVLATLFFARDILIPLALSALLTFLLAPLVTRVEHWIGRIAAVLLVVAMIFAATGFAGWVLTRQLFDLAAKLPEYKGNIATKLHAFEVPKGGVFTRLSETVDDLKKELPGANPGERPMITRQQGKRDALVTAPGDQKVATPVEVVETNRANSLEVARAILSPLLGPMGTGALVLVLVICMLFQREDMRNRLIRLIGQGRISATSRAMDDAGQRVSRYLRMQFMVNLTYGTCIAIGLYFIGVPNAVLWGAFGLVLRFIPYVGPWSAMVLPTVLALAISPHWLMPILTVSLFAGLELILNNIMEPMLYGRHTGVSSIALIVAAVFWTWLWGAAGLVLATPLTVCLAVMGRHVPRLAFLSILLSDDEALTPAEDCYHRLLTPGERDEVELVESYLKTNSLTALYDSVLIPVVSAAEMDTSAGSLEPEQLAHLKRSVADMIDDLGSKPSKTMALDHEDGAVSEIAISGSAPPVRVSCLPARADRDELAGAMLVHLLRQNGSDAEVAPAKLVAGELLGFVESAGADVACISVVAPSTMVHARYLCTKLRARFPRLKIVVGFWGMTEESAAAIKRLRDSGADEVVFALADALVQIAKLAPLNTEPMIPPPLPEDEDIRLAALSDLHLLDTEAEPVFDRITAKLSRIFDVPVALLTLVDRDRQFFKSQVGLPADLAEQRETSRELSVCGHVVAKNEILVIEDLARDRRFANNPLLKQHGFRFYAGAPLRSPDGQPVGSLCLLDVRPRQFTARDERQLQEYAREIVEEFGRRAAVAIVASEEFK